MKNSPLSIKWTRKKIIALILVTCFIGWQSLTLSGFCYADMRWLSERELVEKYLKNERWHKMPNETREEQLEKIQKGVPDCCFVSGTPWWENRWDKILNSLFAVKFFKIKSYYKNPLHNKENLPYYSEEISINSCGTRYGEQWGEGISFEEYKKATDRIKKHWEGVKQ